DLLIAFRHDQTIHRYENWDGVLGYCRYSANPVGRLVLYLAGYRDSERQALSDATCTALQLANFWQDVDRDLVKGRIYIPLDLLAVNGLSADDVVARRFDERYMKVMKELILRTRALFAQGAPLARNVSNDLRVDIELFTRGGLAVLEGIERVGYDTLHHRPAIGRATQVRLLGGAILERCMSWLWPGPSDSTGASSSPNGAGLKGRHA
ncbi:MAG TPA: squalene/phytoene synthase family protein, partial [Candidatus Acidoferrales bacterium]|nr:squalene/phytoene synthase family protein [Candidatus Acidoferrales bacterium]